MTPTAIALALFLQGQPAAAVADAPAPPSAESGAQHEAPMPNGAPKDDYQFVGWCYGLLRGYLDLHDQVMPEVTRIESEFRPPDRKLSDDLKVYADMQKDGKAQLKLFRDALTAAEKASLKPINTLGAAAVTKGNEVWHPTNTQVTPARLAQEWMSWALPVRCEVVAKSLKANATLLGGAFKVNAAEEEAPPPEAADKPADGAARDAAPADATPTAPADATPAPTAPAEGEPAKADPAAVLLDSAADPDATPAPAPAKKPKKKR